MERDRFDSQLRLARFPVSHSPLDVFAFSSNNSLKTLVNFKYKSKTKTFGVGKTSRQVLPTINEVRVYDVVYIKQFIDSEVTLATLEKAVKSTLSNKTTLDKIVRRTARNDDFKRLGLINDISAFRIMKNKFMTVCQTYPPILIQPLTVSDDVMKSMGKLFKRNRIPAIVWQTKESAILARSEAFSSVSDLLRIRRRPGDDRDPVKDLEMWMLCVVKDRDKTKSKPKTFEII